MLDDLKSAWRRLRHAPGFAVAAVFTLAIAVGANTAILSIADAVLFRPLPYQDAERVFVIQLMQRSTGTQATRMSYDLLRLIDDRHGSVGQTELLDSSSFAGAPDVVESTPDGAVRVPVVAVTPDYFRLLGVRAGRGRLFTTEDARDGSRAAVLSQETWRQRFAGDESIIGRSVTVGSQTFDVIGVLPPRFVFPSTFAGKPEIVTVKPRPAAGKPGGTFHPIVRLEPGVTREQAQAEMDAVAAEFARTRPEYAQSLPYLNEVRSILYPRSQPVMRFMLAASGLVLLLGCANLANMLLARGRSREREVAVRGALGASRLRVVRPLLFEALILGVAGSAVALIITTAAFELLLEQVPTFVYASAPVGIDARLITTGLALGVLSAIVFAAVPAWRLSRLDVQAVIQNRMRGHLARRSGAGRPMLVVQVALAVVLVFGAVIATRAFLAALGQPLGFDPDNVITASLFPGQNAGDRQAFFLNTLERLRQRADVVSAGAAGSVPFSGQAYDEGIQAPDSKTMIAGVVHTLPGFFESARIPVRQGRLLSVDDVRSNPDAVVVSESAARVLFPGRDPLGLSVDTGRGRVLHVIGVVGDVRRTFTADQVQAPPPVYVIPGAATRSLTLVVRTRARQESSLVEIRRAIVGMAPGAAVPAAWWSDRIGNTAAIRNPRFQTIVLSVFAGIALILTAVGVFAVVAFLVAARSREMGVRVAIGANPQSLVRLMVKQALLPVAIGLGLGLMSTRWLAGFAESQLYQVDTNDPATLTGAVITVLVASLAAAYLPARRASRVDPIIVLRTE